MTTEIAAQRAATQQANLDSIIALAQNAGFSAEEAFLAEWVAKAESSLGVDTKGRGTISGMYQYGNGRWGDRFNEYGPQLGFGNTEDEKRRWMGEKNDPELQTKVFLKDIQKFKNELVTLLNGGPEAEALLGDQQISKAWTRMQQYGIPETFENYVYMRHNTDPKQVLKENFDRLLDRDGWYSRIEQSVESAYGQQIPDSYSNPSLTPLIEKLADAIQLDISGMNNQEALGLINARLNSYTNEGRKELLSYLSGFKPWDVSMLWKYDPSYRYTRWFSIEHGRGDYNLSKTSPPPCGDPLILDLDGDGIETISMKDGAYFDHDGNGFAEQTGWSGPDDGLLVWDRNGDGIINDGKELFGDQTILQNGERATNGFQALAEWDDNLDGKIDANDAVWSNLKIWRDFDEDGRINRKWEVRNGKWETKIIPA